MERTPMRPRVIKAAELRNNGMSAAQIANAMDVTTGAAYRYLAIASKAGLTKLKYRKLTEDRLRKVADIYNDTYDYYAVADANGVTYSYATELVRLARKAGYADPTPSITGNVECMKGVMSNHALTWLRKQTQGDDTDMHTVGHILMDLYERELEAGQ